jgi:hypothetical protein
VRANTPLGQRKTPKKEVRRKKKEGKKGTACFSLFSSFQSQSRDQKLSS